MRVPRTEPAWLVVLLAASTIACSGGAADARRMRAEVEPYLDDLAEYDRWARRVGLGDSAFHSDAALAEAAFAPLRREGRIAAAWIHRDGPDARRLAYPDDAPELPASGWIRVRTESLGEIEAQETALTVGGEERALMLLRRSAPAPDGATLHVALAFRE